MYLHSLPLVGCELDRPSCLSCTARSPSTPQAVPLLGMTATNSSPCHAVDLCGSSSFPCDPPDLPDDDSTIPRERAGNRGSDEPANCQWFPSSSGIVLRGEGVRVPDVMHSSVSTYNLPPREQESSVRSAPLRFFATTGRHTNLKRTFVEIEGCKRCNPCVRHRVVIYPHLVSPALHKCSTPQIYSFCMIATKTR